MKYLKQIEKKISDDNQFDLIRNKIKSIENCISDISEKIKNIETQLRLLIDIVSDR